MSAIAASKAKGIKLGAEPRKLAILGILIALAIVVVIYNSGSDTPGPSSTAPAVRPSTSVVSPSASAAARLRARRHAVQQRDRNGTLRMQEVTLEAQQGRIDPTLRLDLLDRLKTAKFNGITRSLFESGPAVATAAQLTAKPVKIMPGQLPPNAVHSMNTQMPNPQFAPIPLKFYGFSAPVTTSGPRRGFFLDEDNVVIADEGETVKGHYRIVSLQPKAAEVEDTLTRNKQMLPIVPEVQPNAF